MKKGWLYIPIETKTRELHGKTLLASFAAINGLDVVIGSKQDINFKSAYLPKGIVFNVGLAKNLAKNSRLYKKYGHTVAAIDEEGLVTLNDELYMHHRVSPEALRVTDLFFAWGEKQAALIRDKAKENRCEVFITGNPRFDMLRAEYKVIFDKDVEEIKKEYGEFILVNTNFGHGNHFAGDDFLIESFKEKGWMSEAYDRDFFLHNIEWQKEMLKKFVEMIPELSKNFKDKKIIIRPHPSENHDFWKKIAKDYPNVLVIHSGSVIPWIMASDVLVHNGCTTAVEAFILGIKVVAYRPFIIEDQETELPNKISVEAYNLTELVDILDGLLSNSISDDSASKKTYLDSYLSGIDERTASEKIVLNLLTKINPSYKKINYLLLFYFETLGYIKKIIRKVLFNGDISESYRLHKIPSLSKIEISEIITDFSKIDKRFLNLKIKKIRETCYHIYEQK